MKLIRCLYCSKPTTLHNINAQKKINNKIITLTNAPVYYCKGCDETYISKEAQDAFSYIRDMGLDSKKMLFNFDDIIKRINK